MKKSKSFLSVTGISLLAVVLVLASCSRNDGFEADSYGYSYSLSGDKSAGEGAGNGNGSGGADNGNTQAGIMTAGEWCDLTHWEFWSKLMQGDTFSDKSAYWEFYTNNRVAVQVTDEQGIALAGVKVSLQREGDNTGNVWETVTDNHGMAECWIGLFQPTKQSGVDHLRVSLNGQVMDGHPVACPLDSLLQSVPVNKYVLQGSSTPAQQADIAFIVDATGSMADEIDFLKQDLMDIINKVRSVRPGMKMRTAALFYRDEGDDYVTRHQDFTDNVAETAAFVGKQEANGGGDYPEAVHTALEGMLQNLSWEGMARTRIAFLILDAPAHHETGVIRSLQKSIELCARRGIKVIPVAASGVDKNTEFMLRFFANATGGTYVFITDHSGVGNSHLEASVGNYEVEQLNNLLIRLISAYTE